MKKQKRRSTEASRGGETWADLVAPRGVGEEDASDASLVISLGSARCRIFDGRSERDCVIPPAIASRQKSALAVGDRVRVSEEGGVCRIAEVLPRKSVLARPDPLRPRMLRLIAANIDIVTHVVTLKSPPLRPRLIDRYLIAIERGGARPLICVNKADLLEPQERELELSRLATYRDLGVGIVVCSTKTGEGIDELRAAINCAVSTLVGHSGVGKSSLLNALDSTLAIATSDVLKRGTGRHTTTASTLFDLGGNTYVIDTPGIREFGLWDLERETLRDYFPEFQEAAGECRFNNCVHIHEPDCEVKRRAERGDLARARYETYLRLYEESGNAQSQ